MFDGPALPALDSRVEDQVAVLALEAVDVIVPTESSDPGSLRLTFLGLYREFAGTAAQGKLSARIVSLKTVSRSECFNKLLDRSHHLSRTDNHQLSPSPVIILGAVGLVLLVQGHHLPLQLLPAHLALEAGVVEPHVPDHQGGVAVRGDLLATG